MSPPMIVDYKIIPNRRGYYELWIEGLHIGNYDTPEEAKGDLAEETQAI